MSGCGIATFSVGIGQTAYWFPRSEQGWALGVYAGLGNLAPGIFSFLLPFFLKQFGLISAYFSWAGFLLFGTIVYFLLAENAYYFQLLASKKGKDEAIVRAKELGQELFPAGSPLDSLKSSAALWRTWMLVGLYFVTFGGFIALTAWFPTYWSLYHGLSAVLAGTFTATYSILTSVIRVWGGGLSDRLGGEKVGLVSILILLAGSLLISFTSNFILALVAAVIMALGMGIANVAVFKLVPEYVPDAVGGAAGWVGGLGAFGGFAIPPLMGMIADKLGKVGYARGFLVFVVLSLLCVVLLQILRKSQSKVH